MNAVSLQNTSHEKMFVVQHAYVYHLANMRENILLEYVFKLIIYNFYEPCMYHHHNHVHVSKNSLYDILFTVEIHRVKLFNIHAIPEEFIYKYVNRYEHAK